MIKLKQIYNEIKSIPIELYRQLEDDIDNLVELSNKYLFKNDDFSLENELGNLLNKYNLYGDFISLDDLKKLSIQQVKELKQQLQALYDDYG